MKKKRHNPYSSGQMYYSHVMSNRNHPSSKIATRIAGIGFLLMITHSAQQQFEQKITELNALSQSTWKIVRFSSPNELTANAFRFRTGERKLTLYDQYHRSLEFYCDGFNQFCKDLENQQNTPTQFEFYVRYNPKNDTAYYDLHKLKRIEFLDAQQHPQSIDVMHVTPNSPPYIQATRRSFNRFFLLYGVLYIASCIALLICAFSYQRQTQPRPFYTYSTIAALIGLHYLYFILYFILQL